MTRNAADFQNHPHFLSKSCGSLKWRFDECLCDHQGRWELPQGPAGGQEGGAGRAAEGVHQRMAQTASQGGRGAEAAEGEAGLQS